MSSLQGGGTSLRDERVARTLDREVAPVWHDRFGRLLFRDLTLRPQMFALDVHCGSGRVTAELLQRLDEGSKLLALEPDPALVALAKARVRPEWRNRVYFKPGSLDDVTAMGNQTYDLTLANLVLGEEVADWRAALAELLRVTKPGGQVLATIPLYGTWAEVEDIFEEILRDHDLRDAIRMLQHVRRVRPRPRAIADALMEIGVEPEDFVVEHEHFQLLFRSGREFLFAPVIEHGPLRVWKAILSRASDPQKLFWRFKEAVDVYYAGHTLAVTIVAGVVKLRVPDGKQARVADEYWSRFPELDRIFRGERIAPAPQGEEDFDLDIDVDEEASTEPQVVPERPFAGLLGDDDIDTDAIFAALENTDDLSGEPEGDLDAAFGDTFELPSAPELPPVAKPAAPVSVPPLPVAPTARGSTAPAARPTGPKIPPPPPTGAHRKVSLPPLPKPKKRE